MLAPCTTMREREREARRAQTLFAAWPMQGAHFGT
jgi:hypothetical protein